MQFTPLISCGVQAVHGASKFFYAAIHSKRTRGGNCKVSDLKGMKDLLKLRKETSSVNKLEGKWLDLERQQSQDRQICQSELYSAKWYLV